MGYGTLVTCHVKVYLRNKFNFWNVHGIMNTSSLLQSKREAFGLHVKFAREPKYA